MPTQVRVLLPALKMKRISKTKIERRLQKKSNPRLRNLLILLKKQKKPFWQTIAKELAKPKRKAIDVNLFKINKFAKKNETIVIPGKVLSHGNLNKQIKIAAFSFSGKAREKIKLAGSKSVGIEELIKNPDKNMRIIK